MNASLLVLAGIGMWLFLEGAAYAVAPDFMRRMARMISDLPAREIALSGLISALLGALVLVIAVRAM